MRLFAAAAVLLALITNAEARTRHYANAQVSDCVPNDSRQQCWGVRSVQRYAHPSGRVVRSTSAPAGYTYDYGTIEPHPSGCPRYAFCGCGTAVKVFGEPRRDLWPARAWYRYPRSAPAAGMVEVRPHHVRYIISVDAHGNALFYDPNSGGGRTRIWTDRIRGTVVNPHGTLARLN